MTARIRTIARREVLENLRQPAMIASMSLLLLTIGSGILALLARLDALAADPTSARALGHWAGVLGIPLDDPAADLAGFGVTALNFLVFSQLLGMTAVIAGHVAIHDRMVGTLPFLLLAPVRRIELLAGKVLGALAVPVVVYLVVGGATCALAARFAVTADHAAWLPPAPGWTVAFVVGGPAWAAGIATLCVGASSLAADVRTAQQVSWFIVFFATLILGPLLVQGMALGPVIQGAIAAFAVALTGAGLALGSALLSRIQR